MILYIDNEIDFEEMINRPATYTKEAWNKKQEEKKNYEEMIKAIEAKEGEIF